ncbi:MAG TPA: AAA family ATPase, partial [Chloroflexota bacterium]|nr:AAA family ATPase [Chloroflexota bacterium]
MSANPNDEFTRLFHSTAADITAADHLRHARRHIGNAASLDIGAWRLGRLLREPPKPLPMLLGRLIPRGRAGSIIGRGGSGKTQAAIELCIRIAQLAERDYPGDLPGPLGGIVAADAGGAALYITTEDNEDEFKTRSLALEPNADLADIPFYPLTVMDLPDFSPALVEAGEGRGLSRLSEFAKSGLESLINRTADAAGYPVRLVVLDPAGDFVEDDEDSARVIKPLMRRLREIASATGATIILIGHTAKAAGSLTPRGSGAWSDNGRFTYALEVQSEQDGDKPARIYGCLIKANHPHAPIGVKTLFHRDHVNGRLVEVEEQPKAGTRQPPKAEMEALVTAC